MTSLTSEPRAQFPESFQQKRLLSLQHALGDEGEHLDELARIALDGPPQR